MRADMDGGGCVCTLAAVTVVRLVAEGIPAVSREIEVW